MIYLDSAATTLQKPPGVAQAVAQAIERCASPGRGGYPAGMEAGEVLYRCRETAARLFEVPEPERVVLTSNATHGLNIAIRTLVKPGGCALISGYEHNAVVRPLRAIPGVRVKVAASPLFDGAGAMAAFARELTPEVDAVICNHMSNVFGYIQPVEELARLCRERGTPLIVDASQSAGTLPVSLSRWGAAFVAMPGHKGLYGPQGTGLLLCGMEPEPLLCGGTGSVSTRPEMPDFLPDRVEAGTQNVCGAAGLLAGLRYVEQAGAETINRREHSLSRYMIGLLEEIPGVRVFRGGRDHGSLFSFLVEGVDCELAGEWLGREGVAVRAGLHCAPLAHRSAGTLETGTVRVSFSAFNRLSDTERAAALIRELAEKGRAR